MGGKERSRETGAEAMTAVSKVRTPSLRISPYMKSSRIQPAAHKTQPLSTSAPIAGVRKAKFPSKPPCTSAPAATGRTAAGGAAALKPKRGASGASVRIARERHSDPSIPKPPYVLVPVRLKRTGLKLLDPEKVKSLTSASRLHVSGGTKQTPILHQSTINKQPPRSCKQGTIPRSSAKLTASSMKRTGPTSRREIVNPSGRGKILQADEDDGSRGHQLCHQINHLLLDDRGCDESRQRDDGQLQHAQPGDGRTSGQTVPDDAGSLEANVQDNEKTSQPTDLSATSGQINEAGGEDEEERTLVCYSQTGDVPESGDYKESQPSCRQEENCEVKGSHHEGPPAHPSRPDINVADGFYKPSPQTEPITGTSGQNNNQSRRIQMKDPGPSAPKSEPASLEGESDPVAASKSADKTILGPSLPPDEQNASAMGSQELKGDVWSRTYDIIRQSQGVLVLTRSTDEDAVFIPKLKFEFTPDNSMDWTRPGAPLPLGSNKGGAPIRNDLEVLNACTPRGPTFSKSMLKKKSSMLYTHNVVAGVSSQSALAEIPKISACPLDLSISFQGKYEEQEIPADIPKILLTEEDYDED